MGLASDLFRLALAAPKLVAELRGLSRPLPTPGPVAAAHAIVVRAAPIRTLCVDVGGSWLQALVRDHAANALSPRERVETPRSATPEAVLAALEELALRLGGRAAFERVSVGFPGVVRAGVTETAPNLAPGWADFPLAKRVSERLGRPTRVANDAALQGLALIEGRGVEMVLTLGTTLGTGLYVDGRHVPNLALAHHPLKKGQTYEERIGDAGRAEIGNRRWRKRVLEAITVLEAAFNYRVLYLGGANARRLDASELPSNVRIVDDSAGLVGGVRLWDGERD
jgi:polyphosphate glucokinase